MKTLFYRLAPYFILVAIMLWRSPAQAMWIGGQLKSAMLEQLSGDPSGAVEGRIYQQTTAHKPKIYDGTSWLWIGMNPGTTAGDIEYCSATATPCVMTRLAIGSATTVLHGGASAPSYSAVSLTADVSGILPTAKGGTAVNSTATFPSSGVVVTEAASQTLTNKTLTGNTAVNLVSGAATVTLPTTTGTLATLANSETLTNKDISSSTNTYRAASSSVTGSVSYESTLTYSDSGTTLTWTGHGSGGGASGPTSYTIKFARTGNNVCVRIKFSGFVCGTTPGTCASLYSSAVNSDFWPADNIYGIASTMNGATNAIAAFSIGTTGVITFYKDAANNGFTSGNTLSTSGISVPVCYPKS